MTSTARMLGALALGSTALVGLAASPTHAAPATCDGKTVTIVATTAVTTGTDGDDVVAMEPGAWNTFDALAGNDTICLAIGQGQANSRDPLPPTGSLDAGAGDDTVINLTPAGTTGANTTVVLGYGSDTFTGANVGEVVYADRPVGDFDDPDAVDPALVGAQRDIITGAAKVYTTAPADGPNADRITFGSRGGHAIVAGSFGPNALLDFSAAGDPSLEVRSPSRLAPTAADIAVDARAGTITADGRSVLAWTGAVDTFSFGTPRKVTGTPAAVSFLGTEGDDTVTFRDLAIGSVDLGGGDDRVDIQSYNTSFTPRSAVGGAGSDRIAVSAVCQSLVARLEEDLRCGQHWGTWKSFERVYVTGSDAPGTTTRVIGTDRADRIWASGHAVTVRAGAGADRIGVDQSWSARVSAGDGRDRIWAGGDDVIVRGQDGADRIKMQGRQGLKAPASPTRQQVARGGQGADVMVGTSAARDRLSGGAGRDRANGRGGAGDRCLAEVRTNCERP